MLIAVAVSYKHKKTLIKPIDWHRNVSTKEYLMIAIANHMHDEFGSKYTNDSLDEISVINENGELLNVWTKNSGMFGGGAWKEQH